MRSTSLIISLLLLAGCATQGTLETGNEPGATAAKPLDPAVISAFNRALNDMRNGQKEQARAQFSKLTHSHPQLTGPYVNLGILQLPDEPKQAEAAFRSALKLDPGHAVANNQLALLLRRQGRFADAEAAYLTAMSAHPDYPPLHYNLGILYDLYLGQPEKALRHYQRYQSLQQEPDARLAGWIIDLERRTKEPPP